MVIPDYETNLRHRTGLLGHSLIWDWRWVRMGRCCIWKINRNHSAEKKHCICFQTFYLIRIPLLITRELMFNLTHGMDPNKNIILGIIEYLNSIVLSFSIFFQNMSCSICAIFCSENMNILFLFLQQNGQPRMTHILGKSYNESDLWNGLFVWHYKSKKK